MPALRQRAGRLAGLACLALALLAPAPASAAQVTAGFACPSGPVVVHWEGEPRMGGWNVSWVSDTGETGSRPGASPPLTLPASGIGPLAPDRTYVFTVEGVGTSGPVHTACPTVDAGADLAGPLRAAETFELNGRVVGGGPPLSLRWWKAIGPGVVVFEQPSSASTRVRFSEPGRYALNLTGTHGIYETHDQVLVDVERATLDWSPIMTAARKHHKVSLRTGARGYYEQLLNIACAAARSAASYCKPMFKHRVPVAWAEEWTHGLFSHFLVPYKPTSVARQLLVRGASTAMVLLAWTHFPFTIPLLDRRDVEAVMVGALHFLYDLKPGFKSVTREHIARVRALLGPDAPTEQVEEAALIRAGVIRCQHDALFARAVVPGFQELGKAAGLSKLGAAIAKRIVPWAAKPLREHYIRQGLRKLFGPARGEELYAASAGRGCLPPPLPPPPPGLPVGAPG